MLNRTPKSARLSREMRTERPGLSKSWLKQLELIKKDTKEMLADILAKPVSWPILEGMLTGMGF